MVRDDSKPKNPFAAFLSAFAGGGEPRDPRVQVPRRPLAPRSAAPARRPCNCTGKRRA